MKIQPTAAPQAVAASHIVQSGMYARPLQLVAKRLIDYGGAALGLVLLLPVFVVIAVLIRLDSPGPVFFRQQRLGLGGRPFWIWKFRTMVVDAEARLAALEHRNESDGGVLFKLKTDPRVTRLGGFLRRSSLDELPQLWNVLKGEMSLVGPRPERPVYVDRFSQEIPKYLDRHLVKAGITGWAQIHGLRGDTSIAERVRYDLYYIENWSLLLDLRILISTVWRVLFDSKEVY